MPNDLRSSYPVRERILAENRCFLKKPCHQVRNNFPAYRVPLARICNPCVHDPANVNTRITNPREQKVNPDLRKV